MEARTRLKCAIENKKPDRLPVTTHHLMPAFLDDCFGGISNEDFFNELGLDPVVWLLPYIPDHEKKQFRDEAGRLSASEWRIRERRLKDECYETAEFKFITPAGELKMIYQTNRFTSWIAEHPVKEKRDIEIIADYMPVPICDTEAVNTASLKTGCSALLRSHCFTFEIGGQPGCWQDACCLYGTEKMIMATFDDPQWVHEFLSILRDKKLAYLKSTKGADLDIIELGGGDASTTVISPAIFNDFVAPYDAELIDAAHKSGQKIVYHTCGGMMPILEDIAAMAPDAMETFTPEGMGGDADLAAAKKRVGNELCIIGGFDQSRYFEYSTEAETRSAVQSCFDAAGLNGGYILSPSDHFFTAKPELLHAFADEARRCVY